MSIRTDLADLDILNKWRERDYQQLRTMFASADSDGPTRAARSLANPEHTPERIAAVMRRFLTALNISQ